MMNYEALDEALEYIEAVNEGVNADISAATSKMRKEYRAYLKDAKAAIKAHNPDKAKEHLKKAETVVDDYIKFLESTKAEDVKGSNAIGTIIGVLVVFAKCSIPLAILAYMAVSQAVNKKKREAATENLRAIMDEAEEALNNFDVKFDGKANFEVIINFAKKAAALDIIGPAVAAAIVAIVNVSKDIKSINEELKNDKDPDYNYYRQQSIRFAKDLKAKLKKFEAVV